MHFGFATQPINRGHECLAIGAHGAAQRIIILEDCAKPEGQHGGGAEALAHHARVVEDAFLVELQFAREVTYDDGELAARVAEDLAAGDTINIFNRKGAAEAASQRCLLNDAVCVPSHARPSGCDVRKKTGTPVEKKKKGPMSVRSVLKGCGSRTAIRSDPGTARGKRPSSKHSLWTS